MIGRNIPSFFALAFFATTAGAHARLGETEAQSTARYGAPRPEFIGPQEKPLLEGAKQQVFYFEGWRIRIAFLDDVAVRLEYIHIPDQAKPQKITEKEIETILEAEKGKFSWREIKPRTGYKELNALKTAFEGRQWSRSDHGEAKLVGEVILTVQSRDVDDYEKKLTKQTGKSGRTTPMPKAPKF